MFALKREQEHSAISIWCAYFLYFMFRAKNIINVGGYVAYLEFNEKYFVKLALEIFDNIIPNVETVSKAKTGKNRLY